MKQYFYIYKITLLKGSLAGHYYYGQHRTKHLSWTYAGSGVLLSNYYKKYGKIENETYTKEIISFYDSLDELNKAEAEIIGNKYKNDLKCLNLIAGGHCKGVSDETRKKQSISRKGRHHTDEAKAKIRAALKGTKRKSINKGRISPTKETVWIHLPVNGRILTKMVQTQYIDYWLDDGWKYGRMPANLKKDRKQ